MANFEVTILTQPAVTEKTVKADRYEHNDRGFLIFYKKDNGEPVATFKTWDFILKVQDPDPPPA